MTPEHVPALAELRHGFDVDAELTKLRDAGGTCPVGHPTGHQATVITRYDEVRELHSDSARFRLDAVPMTPGARAAGIDKETMRQRREGNLLAQDPPTHTRLRKTLTRAFTVRRIQQLRPRIEQIVTDHLDAIEKAGPPAELVSSFALPIPSLVICELLGVPYEDRDQFQDRSARSLDAATPVEERFRLFSESRDYMFDLIARHRRDPGDDLLGTLIQSEVLTDHELVGIGNLLLVAGHETTSNMLSLGTLVLLQHPDQLAIVRDDPGMADAAIEELLRYLSVVHGGFPRAAVEDTTIGGRAVASGELLVASLPAANRDPALLADGDVLDVTRRPVSHVAFGHGLHHCLGAPLARMEMQVAFPALLRRFPGIALATDDVGSLFRHNTLIYGMHSLPITW